MKTTLKILTAKAIVAGAISTGYTVEPAEAGAAKNKKRPLITGPARRAGTSVGNPGKAEIATDNRIRGIRGRRPKR